MALVLPNFLAPRREIPGNFAKLTFSLDHNSIESPSTTTSKPTTDNPQLYATMFSRNFFLSLIFALVVLCTTVPHVAVEAKDVDAFFQNNVEAVQQEQAPSALKGSSRTRRVLKEDKAGTPTAAPTTSNFFTDLINLFLSILPFILQLLGLAPAAADEGA